MEKVRFAGEPIAAVAAVSRPVAEDAVDLIEVEYEPLLPVVDARNALEPQAPLVYEEMGTNVIYRRDFKFGDVEAAFAQADLLVKESYRFPRISGSPMETNGCVVRWDSLTNHLTAWGTFQVPLFVLPAIAGMLRLPANRVQLISQPHGGSFGSGNSFVRDVGSVARNWARSVVTRAAEDQRSSIERHLGV